MQNLLEQLSLAQRECLRQVALNRTSKEIARQTGLSPQTVDQYLSRAASILGATNRREAARIFANLETEGFNKPELRSGDLADPPESGFLVSPTVEGDDQHAAPTKRLQWLPPLGGERHDLTPSQTIYAIVRVSFFTTGLIGAILATYYWLNHLLL